METIKVSNKLQLIHLQTKHELQFNVEIISEELKEKNDTSPSSSLFSCLLAPKEQPYDRLHLSSSQGCFFKASTPNRDNLLYFQSIPNPSSPNGIAWIIYNKPNKTNSLCQVLTLSQQSHELSIISCQTTQLSEVPSNCYFLIKEYLSLQDELNLTVKPTYLLSKWQLRRFVNEGYVHLSQFIPQSIVENCRRFLLHHIGLAGQLVPGGVQGKEYGKLPGNVTNSNQIRQLLTPEVQSILKELIGSELFQIKHQTAQIAFRFPELEETRDIEWHTDGWRQGQSHNFTLLVGISLGSVNAINQGNLVVWPNSHYLLHKCRIGPLGEFDREKLLKYIEQTREFPIKKDIEENIYQQEGHLPRLNQPPLQLFTQPGDVVILHSDLAHGGAPNYSSDIRQMLYFRIKIFHKTKDNHESSSSTETQPLRSWEEVIEDQSQDMWTDLIGIKDRLGDELTRLHDIYYNCYENIASNGFETPIPSDQNEF